MKQILTYILILFTFLCDAQITKTEEVKSNVDREIAHIKEIFRTELDAIKMARELQAKEYERRLDELNNEAARLSKMVSSEEYDKFEERTESELKAIRSWQDNMTGKLAVSVGIITLVLFALNYFKVEKKKPTT